jgi:hypothetical protein
MAILSRVQKRVFQAPSCHSKKLVITACRTGRIWPSSVEAKTQKSFDRRPASKFSCLADSVTGLPDIVLIKPVVENTVEVSIHPG